MITDIESLLDQPSLIFKTDPSSLEIQSTIAERVENGRVIRAMYGETYDRFGPTLGSLKYYFFVASIKKALQKAYAHVQPVILVADIATCRNEPPGAHAELMDLGRKRADFVNLVSDVYKLDLEVLLMSEYLHSEEFQQRLELVRNEASKYPHIYDWIKQTVPPSKVGIEEKKEFAYAFEEVATIIQYDIKVGPPREKFYDDPARLVGEALGFPTLQSVYLRPTFPLGFGRGFFFSNEEIEQYGVTPYKAGSKGLQDHRVIIGQTTIDEIQRLTNSSVVSKKGFIPNAVLDLAVIGEMARQNMTGTLKPITIDEDLLDGKLTPAGLKEMAVANLSEFVIDPLVSEMKKK